MLKLIGLTLLQNFWLDSTVIEPLAGLKMIILFIEDNMKEEISAFLLSDLVYQNFYYLVTIYKAIETNSDHHICHLNAHLSNTRYFVKHAFSLVKGWF